SYSALAGAVGGGGLGSVAITYGYQRFETNFMLARRLRGGGSGRPRPRRLRCGVRAA
ncbi:ABC transporter permease, partial [Streptomyces sp. NPDC048491]